MFLDKFEQLIKLPFVFILKTIILVLNIFPFGVPEILGAQGFSQNNRPDLRELKIKIKGQRKLHLGSTIIAYLRGEIINVDLRHGKCRGVYSEAFNDIKNKWEF